MPRVFLLGDLVARAERRADKQSDSHIEPEEWKELISMYVGELYAEAADVGVLFGTVMATITSNGGSTYALPADYMQTISVAVVRPDGRREELTKSATQELVEHARQHQAGPLEARNFDVIDSALRLLPAPAAGGQYEHFYVAQPPNLASAIDSTPVDLLHPSGEAFVTWACAAAGKDKGEVELNFAVAERERAMKKFAVWAVDQRSPYAAKQAFVEERENGESPTAPRRAW